MNSEEVLSSIKKFQDLQSERVHCCYLLNEGHRIYLKSGPQYDFIKFRHLVNEITEDFKRISNGIILLEKQLRQEYVRPDIADYVRKVQEAEKRKLVLVVKLQLAQQNVIDCENPDETAERENLVRNCKKELNDIVEEINNILNELRYLESDLSSA